MRVNIQYTMELEQIPKEMKKLLDYSVVEKLREAVDALSDEPTPSVEAISNMRAVLYEVDERLSDVDAIMRGYISQKLQSPEQVEQAPAEVALSEDNLPVDAETMADVRARLSEHQLETEALKRTFQNWEPDTEGDASQ